MRRLTRRQWIIVGVTVVVLGAVGAIVAIATTGDSSPKPVASPTPSPSSSSPSASPKPAAAPPTCPLTGRPVAKGQDRNRPPLAIKIDNIDLGRPQSGITQADVVVEETVEGGLTRLFAVFQCDKAQTVGPVRSARTSDASLLRLFNGSVVFGYSGSNSHVDADLHSTSHAVLLSYDHTSGLYYRSSGRPAPHNVYTSTDKLLRAGLDRQKNLHAPKPMFTYASKVSGGHKVHSLSLRWSNFASAGWHWGHHVWSRFQNGTRDVVVGGKRVTAANVIVMRIKTRNLGLHDVLGNASPDDVVTGKGRVFLFRDGRRILGSWQRKKLGDPFTFRDSKGHPLALAPGRTWIELLPHSDSMSVG